METLARTPANARLDAGQRALVLDHLGLARSVARRFGYRGEALDDLEQVAYLALVRAAQRFDPDRQVKFSTFATVSVAGELKRHFRDHSWGVRVARSLKETSLNVRSARAELEGALRRSPTVGEVADHLGISTEVVLEAMEVEQTRSLASLDRVTPQGRCFADELGSEDDGFTRVLDRRYVEDLIAALDDDDRFILKRYFFEGCTQAEVGAELGMTQMQVSRILNRTLRGLRS